MSKPFQVGDEVFLVERTYRDGKSQLHSIRKDKIKNITPKRQVIKLESHGTEFNLEGQPEKYQGYSQFSTTLEFWSSELYLEVRKMRVWVKISDRINRKMVEALDRDSLIELDEMLTKLFPKKDA